jgi:prepilin signal peptidase PulO-like enzyme (type II secretory pathway)
VSINLSLFLIGITIGSYLNVVGLRYSEDAGFRSSQKGRSRCPYCNKTLRWYELIPLVSFFAQKRRCLSCGNKISLQYPIVETIAGLILVFVHMKMGLTLPAIIWMVVFLLFIVIFIIDLRLKIIPSSLNTTIGVLGIIIIAYYALTNKFGLVDGKISGSFLGSYAPAFWILNENIYANFLLGALSSAIFFFAIYFLTKGRGMGFGDVRLATSLGILMGWPDAPLALVLSFIIGAVIGLTLLAFGKKKLREAIPFGPFIIVGVTLVFFFGYHILNGYFGLFNIY